MKSSHPIEVEINDPADLSSIYDHITYEKSNAILRMLYKYLGNDTFRDGLRDYCRKHQFASTKTHQLWDALSRASGQRVDMLMSPWTKQQGFPLIDARQTPLESGGGVRLHLRQSRFFSDGTSDEQIWPVPLVVRYTSKSGEKTATAKFMLKEREQTFEINDDADGYVNVRSRLCVARRAIKRSALQVNADFSAFIRVRYDDEMLERLLTAVRDGSLSSVLDRFCLANDLYALVSAGRASIAEFLEFFAAVAPHEQKHIVWQALVSAISPLRNVFARSDPKLRAELDRFVCSCLEPVAERLGWKPQSGEGKLQSAETIDKYCTPFRLAQNVGAPRGARYARKQRARGDDREGEKRLQRLHRQKSASAARSSLARLQRRRRPRHERNPEVAASIREIGECRRDV